MDKTPLEAAVDGLFEPDRRKNNPASYAKERLLDLIRAFQKDISDDMEVGISFVGSGSAAPFRLRAIDVSDPDILILDGIDARENQVRLLQHHSQMAIMLVAIPKVDAKPFRIGFT
jgi:hypothetical protein